MPAKTAGQEAQGGHGFTDISRPCATRGSEPRDVAMGDVAGDMELGPDDMDCSQPHAASGSGSGDVLMYDRSKDVAAGGENRSFCNNSLMFMDSYNHIKTGTPSESLNLSGCLTPTLGQSLHGETSHLISSAAFPVQVA